MENILTKPNNDKEVSRGNLVVYTQKDLLKIFPFKRTKLQQLLNAGALPVVKVGRTYLSSDEMISRWLLENAGRTIYY